MNTSKAARELALKMNHASLLHGDFIDETALLIQAAVKDLVEKAQTAAHSGPFNAANVLYELDSAVAPWLPDGQEGQ